MRRTLLDLYERIVLQRPLLTIVLCLLVILGVGYFARDFHLDASADSLMLENDQDLKYYRSINARYGGSEFVIISYTPKGDLLADATLNDLRSLRSDLLAIDKVEKVTSLLDVPLIDSPRVSLGDLGDGIKTLDNSTPDKGISDQPFISRHACQPGRQDHRAADIFYNRRDLSAIAERAQSTTRQKLRNPAE